VAAGALGLGAAAIAVMFLGRDRTTPAPPASASRLLQVVSTERRAFDATLSPDGRLIGYVGEATDGRIDLFLTDARGEGQVRLTNDDAIEQEPDFLPHGNRLVFASLRADSMS